MLFAARPDEVFFANFVMSEPAYVCFASGVLTHPGHELRVLPNRLRNLFLHGHVGLEIGRPKLPSGQKKPFLPSSWHAGPRLG